MIVSVHDRKMELAVVLSTHMLSLISLYPCGQKQEARIAICTTTAGFDRVKLRPPEASFRNGLRASI